MLGVGVGYRYPLHVLAQQALLLMILKDRSLSSPITYAKLSEERLGGRVNIRAKCGLIRGHQIKEALMCQARRDERGGRRVGRRLGRANS